MKTPLSGPPPPASPVPLLPPHPTRTEMGSENQKTQRPLTERILRQTQTLNPLWIPLKTL